MKKLFSIFVLTATVSQLFGQSNLSKVSFDLFYQPNLAFKQPVEGYSIQRPKYGYDLGIAINYSIFYRVSISSGISFQNKGYLSEIKLLTSDTGTNYYTGTVNAINYKCSFYFISIPFRLDYLIYSDDKIWMDLTTGISSDILLKEKVEYSISVLGTRTYKKDDVNLSGFIGFKVNASIFKNVSVFVQPNFNIFLKSSNDKLKDYKFRDLGMKIGLNYKI